MILSAQALVTPLLKVGFFCAELDMKIGIFNERGLVQSLGCNLQARDEDEKRGGRKAGRQRVKSCGTGCERPELTARQKE